MLDNRHVVAYWRQAMYKHALIITAYNEIDFLIELLQTYSKYFKVYVHIDKKCKITPKQAEILDEICNGRIIQKYKIAWGSYKHILAILDLLKLGMDDGCDFFSVISANTIPIKNPEYIKKYFQEKNKIFMEYFDKEKLNKKQILEIFEYRTKVYYFQHLFAFRKGTKFFDYKYLLEQKLANFQYRIGIRRNISFRYKGYVYCHFPLCGAKVVTEYLEENPNYIKKLKYCYVGEEYFFQNIFMKSDLANRVINSSQVYDIWSQERGNPAFLNVNDFVSLKNTECLFARKVSSQDKDLFFKIKEAENF